MLPNKYHNNNGTTLVDVLIGVSLTVVLMYFGSKMLLNSSMTANLLKSKVELRTEMTFVQQRINRFWNTRVNLGEPAPAPQPFAAGTTLDRYFTINFRRNAMTTTDFDSISFQTQCATPPAKAIINGYVFPTQCGYTCPAGQVPYVQETFSYSGATRTRPYPVKYLVSGDQGGRALVGMAICAMRSNYDEVRIQLIGFRKPIIEGKQTIVDPIKDKQLEQIYMESMIMTSVKTVPNVELIYKP